MMYDKLLSPLLLLVSLVLLSGADAVAQVYADPDIPGRRIELPSPVAPSATSKQQEALFAQRIDINVPFDSSEATTLSDGTLFWSATFVSPGAFSMSLCLEAVSLPLGGSLSVTDTLANETKTVWIGGDKAITPTIPGSAIVVRYTGPATPIPTFTITAANCGFRDVLHERKGTNKAVAGSYGSSSECEISAVCYSGSDKQRRSVCRLILNGIYFGTGTLVNNTSNDRAPLVLTAAHVVGSAALTSCEALFGYEEYFCQNDYGVYCGGTECIYGGTLLAFDAGTDMAVIRLSQSPSVCSVPYWSGWDLSDASIAYNLFCIHHPYGDAKKVSVAPSATPRASYTSDKNALGGSFTNASHWLVPEWSDGATEGGSSGSALFNSDGRVIGALSGGASSCKSPKRDYYWMLSAAWDASSNGYKTLSDVLDPTGSGITSLGGLDFVESDGVVSTSANYDLLNAEAYEADALSFSMTHIVQPLTLESSRTIWAIGLTASDVSCISCYELSAETAKVEVGLSTSSIKAPSTTTYAVLSDFDGGTVFFALPTPLAVTKDTKVYIHVMASNFSSRDALYLLAVDADSDYMLQESTSNKSTLSVVTGRKLAVNMIYSEVVDTAIADVSIPDIEFSVSDGVVSIQADALSLVAVYDRQGRLMTQLNANGDSYAQLDLCAMPSGLYIVRTLTQSGSQASFKFLNY